MFYTFFDIIHKCERTIDFEEIKLLSSGTEATKSKDNFGNNIDGFDVVQYYIRFDLGDNLFNIQYFEKEKDRDKTLSKIKLDWLKFKNEKRKVKK
jgi:hypothetical protein